MTITHLYVNALALSESTPDTNTVWLDLCPNNVKIAELQYKLLPITNTI